MSATVQLDMHGHPQRLPRTTVDWCATTLLAAAPPVLAAARYALAGLTPSLRRQITLTLRSAGEHRTAREVAVDIARSEDELRNGRLALEHALTQGTPEALRGCAQPVVRLPWTALAGDVFEEKAPPRRSAELVRAQMCAAAGALVARKLTQACTPDHPDPVTRQVQRHDDGLQTGLADLAQHLPASLYPAQEFDPAHDPAPVAWIIATRMVGARTMTPAAAVFGWRLLVDDLSPAGREVALTLAPTFTGNLRDLIDVARHLEG